MAQDVAQKLSGRFIDEQTLEPVKEDGGCYVEFFMEAEPDQLLTEGGVIEKKHPQVKEIRKMEQEALAALRAEFPFSDPEPVQPAKDAPPPVQRQFSQAHEEWDERRLSHDADLKEKATLLRDHHEFKDLLVVSPAGRPIFTDREFIRIVVPGDKDNMPVRRVRQADIEAYREKYNLFKQGLSQATTGTPLEQWPGLTKAQVRELSYFNVRTVEQLAKLSDTAIQGIGPYMAYRRKAQDWLATARGVAPVEEARAEAQRLRDEMAVLRRQMAEMAEAQAPSKGKQART
jgi:hypothetical protein